MENIELVIKIPKKVHFALTHTKFDASLVVEEMRKSIANGTPLDKIRAEIMSKDGLEEALEIIDKYRA